MDAQIEKVRMELIIKYGLTANGGEALRELAQRVLGIAAQVKTGAWNPPALYGGQMGEDAYRRGVHDGIDQLRAAVRSLADGPQKGETT